MARQPAVFGGTIEKDSIWSVPLLQCREEFKLADDFDAAAIASPPLQERAHRLRLAREPMPDWDGDEFVKRVELSKRLANGCRREKVEWSWCQA